MRIRLIHVVCWGDNRKHEIRSGIFRKNFFLFSLFFMASIIACSKSPDASVDDAQPPLEKPLPQTIKTPRADQPTEQETSSLGVSENAAPDTHQPLAIIRSPQKLAINRDETVIFTIIFEDNVKIDNIDKNLITPVFSGSAYCNSSHTGSGTNTDPIILSFSDCSGDGTTTIAVPTGAAKDSSGNISELTLAGTSVTVDNSGPLPEITYPSSGVVFLSNNVTSPIIGTCEGGLNVTLSGDVPPGQSVKCNGGLFKFSSWAMNDSTEISSRIVSVSQTDPAGNTGFSKTLSATLNKFLPQKPTLIPGNVIGLTPTISGTCDPHAESHEAISSRGIPQEISCSANGILSILLHLPHGGQNFTVTLKSKNFAGSVESASTEYTRTPFICPAGYIGVPKSKIPGLGHAGATNDNTDWWLNVDKDFCIMKYPAKNNHDSTFASSTIEGSPWTPPRGTDSETAGSAFKACADIPTYPPSPNGVFRLISNMQWQTIARNIEGVSTNYYTNGYSAYRLYQGAFYFSSLPENSTDDKPYYGIQNPEGYPLRKRTHILSNGEVIWDMAGYLRHWVSDNFFDLGFLGGGSPTTYCLLYSDNKFSLTTADGIVNRRIFGPSNKIISLPDLYNFGCLDYYTSYTPPSNIGLTRSNCLKEYNTSSSMCNVISIYGASPYSPGNSGALFRCAYLPN